MPENLEVWVENARIRHGLSSIRVAMQYLAACWDALSDAEELLDTVIEVEEIAVIASRCAFPADAFNHKLIPDGDLLFLIEEETP